MKLVLLAFLPIILYLSPTCMVQGLTCQRENRQYAVITDSFYSSQPQLKCWIIQVPHESYIRLHLMALSFPNNVDCSKAYVKITETETNETYTFCYGETRWKPITALSDVNVTYAHYGDKYYSYSSSFKLNFTIENIICAQKNHFRCSDHHCIHKYQVCNGIEDCENGTDEVDCGIEAIRMANISRKNAIDWLKRRQVSFGWGADTHRAITALYLTGAAEFRGSKFDEEAMVKQLELQTTKSLLRNSTHPMTVNELSMYVNALSVTCHNYRNFYGYDLLRILAERAFSSPSPSPGAYLTLCNANWTLSATNVQQMLDLLTKDTKYGFLPEIQAMAVMALSCIKERTRLFREMNATDVYEEAVVNFVANQQPDGSFGNAHTTAVVAQALLSSGQATNKLWNSSSTLDYLMQHLNSSATDFLSVYLTLPIFRNKNLGDVGRVDCSKYQRKLDEDDDVSDVTNKLGGRIQVQYSLYVGDKKDVIHTIYLRVPDNSSAYDVMRVAEVVDPKYKFSYQKEDGHVYVYKIANINNDMEAGKFWLLYTSNNGTTLQQHVASPDKIIVENKEHLILWYKIAHI